MRYIKEYNNFKSIVDEFFKFVVSNGHWDNSSIEMYNREKNLDWDNSDEYDFDHNNFYVFNLYSNDGIELYDDDDKVILLDSKIEYFIAEIFNSDSMYAVDFYVYDNGKFREPHGRESDYLNVIDEQLNLIELDPISTINYEDWKKLKKQSYNVAINLNK